MKKRARKTLVWLGALILMLATTNVYAITAGEVANNLNTVKSTYPSGNSYFTGSFSGGIQCKGFANYVFYHLFGMHLEPYIESTPWKLRHNGSTTAIGELTNSQITEANVKSLFQQALTGDVIQAYYYNANKGKYSQHSMIIEFSTDWGIHVYEANYSGVNQVGERDISYAAFADKYSSGITLNRATNYETVHTHAFNIGYEAAHPHREYRYCSCGYTEYTGNYVTLSSCSQCTTPGKPSLIGLRNIYEISDAVEFNWNATANTTHYNLYIYKLNENYNYDLYELIQYASPSTLRILEPGYYKVILQSTNSNAYTSDGSTWIFTNSDDYYLNVFDSEKMKPAITSGKYMVFTERVSWYAARDYCEMLGGHLAIVDSEAENKDLFELIQGCERDFYWLGASKALGTQDWYWANGTKFWSGGADGQAQGGNYTNWNPNEPNCYSPYEDYLCMYKSSGGWDDVPYHHGMIGFICEFDEVELYYHPNNGGTVPEAVTTAINSEVIVSSIVPTREGFRFLGWSVNSNAVEADYVGGDIITMTADTTLFAVWKAIPYTKSTLTAQGRYYICDTSVYNLSTPFNIYVPYYKCGQLIGVAWWENSTVHEQYFITEDFDTVKVLVLDDLNSMKPLTKAEVLTK